ncbi:anaerobic ribonucleoside-triphosphate reductase [Candidatus Woesearchaeota archaeon]|nr:anaerobic ribonucleoside-triphosphate reductase [Candidatus Woesearchaeota archaeon]MBW3021742.1 anaerobic ribonucleoside-triphosphate reductase [Candidatus Woesearchaeota archaeon]
MNQKATCELCRKPTNLSNVTYIPKGKDSKMLICSLCLEKRTNIESRLPYSSANRIKKQEFFCKRCKYNFRHDVLSHVRCPYCGRDDQVIEKKQRTAAEILNSIED